MLLSQKLAEEIYWTMVSADTCAFGAATKEWGNLKITKSFDKPGASQPYAAKQVILADWRSLKWSENRMVSKTEVSADILAPLSPDELRKLPNQILVVVRDRSVPNEALAKILHIDDPLLLPSK